MIIYFYYLHFTVAETRMRGGFTYLESTMNKWYILYPALHSLACTLDTLVLEYCSAIPTSRWNSEGREQPQTGTSSQVAQTAQSFPAPAQTVPKGPIGRKQLLYFVYFP